MDDNNSPFTFGSNNGENPDRILKARPAKSRPGDNKVNILNKKIIFFVLFIACLIGAGLYFTYRNIQKTSTVIQKTGSEEIKKISEHIETQLAHMAELHQSSENTFNKKFASIEAKLSSMNKALSKTDKSLKKMVLAKAGKKKTETALKTIEKTLATIKADAKAMASKLDDVNMSVSEDFLKMKSGIEKAQADLTALKTDVTQLSSSKADTNKLNDVIESQRLMGLKLNMLKKQIDAGFLSYDKKIKDLSRSHQLAPSTLSNQDEAMPKRAGDERLLSEEDIK